MSFTRKANEIFCQAIRDYHLKDNVDTPSPILTSMELSNMTSTQNAGLTPFSGIWRTSSAIRTSYL